MGKGKKPKDWKDDVNWKVIALFPLVPIAIAIALLPQLGHALDFGSATITLAELAAGQRPDSGNVTITGGRALYEHAYQLTTTTDGSVSQVEQFVPVVPLDWQPGQPVPLLLHIDRGISYDTQVDSAVIGTQVFTGIARDILWEGVSAGDRAVFANMGLTVSEDALLVDLNRDKYLFYLYSAAPFFAALVMAYIARMMINMARDGHKADAEFEKKFQANRQAALAKLAAQDDDDDDDDDEDDDDDDDDDDA
jgi:hypothetical protein